MTPPKLSLVIATYNRGPRIASTLDTVLAQTVPPDEVVIVDDCSPDRTGDWVGERYPSFRVVRPARNGGTSAARNFGARAATGEVLLFLDHDDELLPHAVETLRGLLAEFPEARAAHADHTYVNKVDHLFYPDHHTAQPAFHRLRQVPALRTTPTGRLYGRAMYQALLRGNLLQQPWAIYRDTFLALGGFAEDIRYCEDWDFYMRVTDAVPIVLSDRVISNHIVEGENLHLSPHQAAMHQRALQRRLRCERFRNPRAAWLLSRRLAGYLKAAGDQARSANPAEAWKLYLHALWYWPFDHVVAARALLWFFPAVLSRKAPAGSIPPS